MELTVNVDNLLRDYAYHKYISGINTFYFEKNKDVTKINLVYDVGGTKYTQTYTKEYIIKLTLIKLLTEVQELQKQKDLEEWKLVSIQKKQEKKNKKSKKENKKSKKKEKEKENGYLFSRIRRARNAQRRSRKAQRRSRKAQRRARNSQRKAQRKAQRRAKNDILDTIKCLNLNMIERFWTNLKNNRIFKL